MHVLFDQSTESRSFCYFPTRGCWNGFYGIIETGIITVLVTFVVSQAIDLCHSSCYVHVARSCLVIFLCVCDMLCMYYLITLQYLGLFLIFQPAVVGMVIIALY